MSDITTKILPKKRPTTKSGIFYKEVQQIVIDKKGKITTSIIDKVYVVRYRDGAGKERLVTIGKYSEGFREAYCKIKLDEYVSLARHGELPPQLERQQKKIITTLNDLAVIYFTDKVNDNKANLKQLQRYNIYFGHIEPSSIKAEYGKSKPSKPIEGLNDFGARDINTLTKSDLAKFVKQLQALNKAPQTINGVVTLLVAIINHSIKEKDLKFINPLSNAKKIKFDDTRERFLNKDEVEELLKHTKDNEMIDLFTKIALSTGARLEGVLHIQKKDIDLAHSAITLKDLKNGSTYTGFFNEAIKVQIEKTIINLRANSYIFGGGLEPLTSRVIQRKLKPILDKLFNNGLDIKDAKNRVVIHTLRHTFASHLAINDTAIFTIQKLMNHSNINMTMRYAKLAPDSGRDAVRGLYNV